MFCVFDVHWWPQEMQAKKTWTRYCYSEKAQAAEARQGNTCCNTDHKTALLGISRHGVGGRFNNNQRRWLQALGVADKKSTKAFKLSSAKQRKQQAKGLWSKAE